MQATNISFSKLVKIDDYVREVNFRKLPNTDNKYHVDVTDDRGHRIMFTMHKDAENRWQFSSQQLPVWLQFSENKLGELIEQEPNS